MSKKSLIAVLVATLPLCASAQDQADGREEYLQSCASCHGQSGEGDGPVAAFMSVEVPDLTMLAARNDEEFPMLKVMQIIDGRTGARGHGVPMPVWGRRYSADATTAAGEYGAEAIVRKRIQALAGYLASLQR